MKASVVIPTKNRSKLFLDTLESVLNQTYPADDYEIVIVDSSTDDTPSLVQSFLSKRPAKPVVHCLREDRVGLHYARHTGAKASQGEIFAEIEDDAIADRNWLAELVTVYDSPEVVCAGGKVLPRWEEEPPSWVTPFQCYLTILDFGDQLQEMTQPNLAGCNFSVRRDVLFRVGGFNPDIMGSVFLGDGDTGLQRKILRAGLGKILYVPKAIVWHSIPSRRLTLDYFRWRYYNEGASYAYTTYHEKTPDRLGLLLLACRRAFHAILSKSMAVVHSRKRDYKYHYWELYSHFLWRQVSYFLRLTYDGQFRDFVQKEDWIND